jgi:biopolymer transport protein ExbB/TolQ
MPVINYIPYWIAPALITISILALVLKPLFPYQNIVHWASIVLLLFSIYVLGAQHMNQYWTDQSKQAEQKLEKMQLELKLNNKHLEQTLKNTKDLLNKQQKSLEAELLGIDTTQCTVPSELVNLLNKASKP